jgi:hypothetical protein
MPKEWIVEGVQDAIERAKEKFETEGIFVPRYGKQPCLWKTRRQGYVQIPFQVILDVVKFSLENALVRLPGGVIVKQSHGIPMGDPLSPGMTILACAKKERVWLEKRSQVDKKNMVVGRYMDDILMITGNNEKCDATRKMKELGEVYSPLNLEKEEKDTFLETAMTARGNKVRYRLKNDNEEETKIWRYQHFHSSSPFMQKRGTLAACLRKVHTNASDVSQLRISATAKLREFIRLGYPHSVLFKACSFMGATTSTGAWITIRLTLKKLYWLEGVSTTVQRPAA